MLIVADEFTLFRPEAKYGTTATQLGAVRAKTQNLQYVVTSIGIGCFTLLALFGYFGTYTKKSTVKGEISSTRGVIHTLAPAAGVVTKIHVAENHHVDNNALLFELATELHSPSGKVNYQIGINVKQQINILQNKIIAIMRRTEKRNALSDNEITRLTQQHILLKEEEMHWQKSLKAKISALKGLKALREDNAISLSTLNDAEEQISKNLIELSKLKQSMWLAESEKSSTTMKMEEEKINAEIELQELMHTVLDLENESISNEAAQNVVVTAYQSGTITAINTNIGDYVNASSILASLYPDDSAIEAALYVPTKDIGFIQEGQTVSLRVTAYPYQKFGTIEAKINNISRTPYHIDNMATELSATLSPGQKYYKVTAYISTHLSQGLVLYPELKIGLVFDADINLEKRRLFEWILNPIQSIYKKT